MCTSNEALERDYELLEKKVARFLTALLDDRRVMDSVSTNEELSRCLDDLSVFLNIE